LGSETDQSVNAGKTRRTEKKDFKGIKLNEINGTLKKQKMVGDAGLEPATR
jgi:hypothetical protein